MRLAVVLAVVAAFSASADMVLTRNGQPVATIVIAAEPSPQAAEGAKVLQEYVQRISGAQLAIRKEGEAVDGPRIYVGRGTAVDGFGIEIPSGHTHAMNEEGFVVKTVGADLVLAGNEEWQYRGTLFAVYDFLEDNLGCRWYSPGPFGEVVPAYDSIIIPSLDRTERPSFRIRDIWYSGWMPANENDRAWLARWYDLNKLNKLDLSLPGDGSITALAPAEQYFAEHPEIYAVDEKGERMKDMLCMTEPEAVRIAVDTIKNAFRADPNRITLGFAPPDGHPQCHCPRCQAYFPGFMGKGYGDPSLSELWFQFANRIAAEVYKEFPDRWVLTNGYANRVRPVESVKPLSPNLGIQSAVLSACTFHYTGDPSCWQRIAYKQVLDRWLQDLDFVIVYDYEPGKALDHLPCPMLHNLKRDFPYFEQAGLWGFWTEGTNAWMVNQLSYYARAKLMWDADGDIDEMLREYCRIFYGPAQDGALDYISALEKAVDVTPIHETWGRAMSWRPILDPIKPRLDRYIADAERRAVEEPFKTRVRVLRLVHDHLSAELEMEHAAADGRFGEAVAAADRMFALREQAEAIQTGLLPRATEISAEQGSSIERAREACAALAEKAEGKKGQVVALLPREWEFKTDPEELGILWQWYNPGTADGWSPIDTTHYWEAQGWQDEKGWSYAGKAWYRTRFDVPADAQGKTLKLTFGGIYNRGVWLWVNGVLRPFESGKKGKLGFYDGLTPIEADVTDLVRPGESNTVAVLVDTEPPGRNPRSGFNRRAFLWTPATP